MVGRTTSKVSKATRISNATSTFSKVVIACTIILGGVYYGIGTSSINEALATLKASSPPSIVGIEGVQLNSSQIQSIKDLGLTPKIPIKLITLENGEQIINGRFLHITDFHPDPFYKEGSDPAKQCHAGEGTAGAYGDAILGCDSPMVLMNDTIKWVSDNLQDKIDFIVWTGDNVRHDNDRQYPRTEMNIFEMNQHVSDLMYDTFRNKDNDEDLRRMQVELIPSLGNNDVYPHNLFSPGPTLQTREMFKIWQNFIPQPQLHIFNRGAYFFQEVIPNQLAILSINTLYLFQSNPLVDNCDSRKQPGYKLFEWIGYVLKEMRARNMKVWLTGHVPPNEKNYDISCLRKYIVWSHEYRDVIIGGLYGHMNMDHFIPLDSVAAYKSIRDSKKGKTSDKKLLKEMSLLTKDFDDDDDDDEETSPLGDSNMYRVFDENYDESGITIQGGIPGNKVKYFEGLREDLYSQVKGKAKSGELSQRYSIAHVTASVVPTFNPGLRVWEYNITNLQENIKLQAKYKFESWDNFFVGLNTLMLNFDKYDDEDEEVSTSGFKTLKKDKTLPPKMPSNLPLGPAYVPQTFTPERYVQFYADLEKINSGEKKFGYEIEYATDDKLYGMSSLVVDEWITFARKLGKPLKDERNRKQKKPKKNPKKSKKKSKESKKLDAIWQNYLKNAFVSSDYENKGYG